MIHLKKTFKVLFAVATCFIFFASVLLFTRRSKASQKVTISSIDDQMDKQEYKYDVTIPNLLGEDYSKVASDKIIKTSEEYNDEIPEGCIISQSIPPGSKTDSIPLIEVTVSKGFSTVVLPEIAGLSISEASTKLSSLGLVPSAKKIESNLPEGTVIQYSNGVVPGSNAKLSEKIYIDISG